MSIDLNALRTRIENGFGPVAITREELLAVIEDSETSRRVANDALDRESERMRENHDLTAEVERLHAIQADRFHWENMARDAERGRDHVMAERDSALAENAELREQMSTMHPSVVHDCCVMVQQVRVLADTIEAEIAPFAGSAPTVVDRIREALVVTP